MKHKPIADQTQFVTEQSQFQTPPEDERDEMQEKQPMSGPKKALLIAGGLLGAVLVVSVIYRLFFFSPPQIEPELEPTPTPEIVSEPSVLEAELKSIEDKLDTAHPDEQLILPPPVDMKVEF